MAQLTVRLPDDFYKQVQRIANDYLEMDISAFVRELFTDTVMLWAGADLPRARKALAAVGQKYRLMGPPTLLLIMADHWRAQTEMRHKLENEPLELMRKKWSMTPEDLKNALRKEGIPEEQIGNVQRWLTLMKETEFLYNDPEMARRMDKMTEEEREEFVTETAWERMIKTSQGRRDAMRAERKPKGEEHEGT
jgi:hypothetical protein